jgi:LuxR family quorum-sensing transcriptional regulator LasR
LLSLILWINNRIHKNFYFEKLLVILTDELLVNLLSCETEEKWCNTLFSIAQGYGFEQTLYAVIPNKRAPLENAFLRSNYSPGWRTTYDQEKLAYVDPTVGHCLNSTVPLVWASETFQDPNQKDLYEEACGYGIRSGIIYPIHGANGEFGVFSFVSDVLSDQKFRQELIHAMPALALLRDYAFESSRRFLTTDTAEEKVRLTERELEVLKWTMAGKSSWEISKILYCAEATINFHLSNIRRKFEVTTRQQAVIKAIRIGLINPD